MATFGTHTLIKNEARWIRPHLASWLPFVDEMVFFDGGSTDGTLEAIEEIAASHPAGHKIKLYRGKDCKDLQGDYERLSDECLHVLTTDYAMFGHPDMMLDDPGNMSSLGDALAYTTTMRSFAGEPDGPLFEIKTGRAEKWKNVFRLRNPDLGLHYHGHYGSADEDCYFSKITGRSYQFHGQEFDKYPYEVKDSGIKISHFSDVRPLARRVDRMYKCLMNQGHSREKAAEMSHIHPRVNFKDGFGFKFEPAEYPSYLLETANV